MPLFKVRSFKVLSLKIPSVKLHSVKLPLVKILTNSIAFSLCLLIFVFISTCTQSKKTNSGETIIDSSATPTPTPSPTATADFSKLKPTCFTAANSNPVYTNGTYIGSFAKWNDPSIIKVANQYIMYVSSPGDSVSPDFNIKIYRFTSADKNTWNLNPTNPVLSAGTTGAWDEKSVETPSVVFFNNQYHLFYTGYKNSPNSDPAFYHHENYRIGHAISDDGINFIRDTSFIISPTCPNWKVTNQICTDGGNHPTDFNAWLVGEPGAVVFNNQLYLYFVANGYHTNITPNNPLQVIGLTKSANGIDWSTPLNVLEPDQTLFPRVDQSNNDLWVAYSTPSAIVLDQKIHLFYDVATNVSNNWIQRRLHHSSSANGENSWTSDSSVIFSNTDFSWTAHEIRSPSLLLDGQNLIMWFAGDDGSVNLGIGSATCPL